MNWREPHCSLSIKVQALASSTDEGDFSGYYVRFHPTLLPYLAPQLAPARRAELEARYAQAYYAAGKLRIPEDNKNPLPTRAIVSRELPNFRRALDLTLAAGDLDTAADFADSIARFLDVFGRWSERDAMMEVVSRQMAVGSSQESGTLAVSISQINGRWSVVHGHAAEFLMQSATGRAAVADGPRGGGGAGLSRFAGPLGRCAELRTGIDAW